MTDPHTTLPAATRRRHRRTAVIAAATLATAMAPLPLAGPATAAPAETCEEALPYAASASADLLRLGALDLAPLGLPIGPVADVRIASTGSGMAADADPATAAAAQDIAAELLGLDVAGLLPAAELGETVYQEAPPANPGPDAQPGSTVDLGILRAELGESSAHARWREPMRCGAETGVAGVADAALVDAAVLPAGRQALVALPGNLSSHAETGLVELAGGTAARATASASLADLRLFAGSSWETAVRVISEPALEATATGVADSSSVRYHAPLLEISGPGIGTHRLDTAGTHLDLALPGPGGAPEAGGLPTLGGDGGDPVEELLTGLTGLEGVRSGPAPTERPLELAGLPGLASTGQLPVLGDVLSGASTLAGLGELTVLRLSIGELHQEIGDTSVRASAASLRLQLLAWEGGRLTEQTSASAVLDLGIGLLEAAATAPAPLTEAQPPAPSQAGGPGGPGDPSDPGGPGGPGGFGDPSGPGDPGDGCGGWGCAGERLPATGPGVAWILAGAGVLLAATGRLLMLAGRNRRNLRIGRRLLG
jgi:hypothetical protein